MTALTDDALAAMEAQAASATAGPWRNVGYFPGDGEGPHVEDDSEETVAVCARRGGPVGDHDRAGRANADFIAAARDDVPALIAEVRRLRAEVAASSAIAVEVSKASLAAGRADYDEMERLTAQRDALAASVRAFDVADHEWRSLLSMTDSTRNDRLVARVHAARAVRDAARDALDALLAGCP